MTEQEQKAFTAMREEIIKHIEDAIKDHCSGSDLYMSALVAAGKIQALTAANTVSHPKPETTPTLWCRAITSESAANAVQPQGEATFTIDEIHQALLDAAIISDTEREDILASLEKGTFHPQTTEPQGYAEVLDVDEARRGLLLEGLKLRHGMRLYPQATDPSPQKLIALALEGMELHDFNAPEYKISAELVRINKALSGQAAAPEAP